MIGHAIVVSVTLVLVVLVVGGVLVQRYRCPGCGKVPVGTDHLCRTR